LKKLVSISGDNSAAVTTPKPPRGIGHFFSKLSKDEYHKELERTTAKAVLTIRAMVHSPEPPTVPTNCPLNPMVEIAKGAVPPVKKAK
jgi:hypothetical protein